MAEPLAYFLTWTCYGTWLHGDDRGSVDRHQNSPNEDFIAPTRAWSEWSARELKGEIVTLSEPARRVVAVRGESAAERRSTGILPVKHGLEGRATTSAPGW